MRGAFAAIAALRWDRRRRRLARTTVWKNALNSANSAAPFVVLRPFCEFCAVAHASSPILETVGLVLLAKVIDSAYAARIFDA